MYFRSFPANSAVSQMEIRFSREWRYTDILNVIQYFCFYGWTVSIFGELPWSGRITSYSTRDPKEIAKLLALVP